MKINWKISIILGAAVLIRPLMSILGVTEIIGQPYTSLGLTLLISIVWIGTVMLTKERRPILTLVMAGVSYASFVIILSGILSALSTGEIQGPLTNPLAVLSVFATNIIWGLITGSISWVIMKILN
ncbi:hypothetical protein AALF85_10625 [Jeotgalicoccus halotolerans]|uniref:hypothetical protein n=1 Tax=Jeotgalicoccus halotolerans TaxID=157227 RepID=UPI0035117E15